MDKTKSFPDTNALKPCKTRTKDDSLNQQKLLLRRCVAAYLRKFGYVGTLSAFQSEAKVDDWGAQSLDLERIFNKHLEISENPPEVITTKISKQDPGKEVVTKSELGHDIKLNQGKKSKGDVEIESKKTDLEKGKAEDEHEVEKLHANLEEKKKKKSKVSSKTPADDIQHITQEVAHEREGDDINLKLKDQKKKKEEKDNHENVVEVASKEKVKCKKSKSKPQVTELADERDTQSKDKKKKKHKLLPDAEMMDSLKECSVVNDENGKDPKLGETVVKSKEMKKEKRKSLPDSDISDPDRRGHENGLGTDDKTDAKSNDKKKKKHKLRHDSDQTNPVNGGDENGFDVERKDSKKRKRLASEEGAPTADHILAVDVSVTKKEATEGKKDTEVITKEKNSMSGLDINHCKKRKVEKSEEGLIKPNGTAPDTKNKEGGFSQNTMKKEQNGSAEPKTVNAFRRVKSDEVKFADERLQDNSYWAKDGADTGYGAKAQEVLGQVRGRDFRHEKTKKKRGSYRGGQIDLQSHSIKFNYSDDE